MVIVRENINFERGKDPWQTLELGIKNKILKAIKLIKIENENDEGQFEIKLIRWIFEKGVSIVTNLYFNHKEEREHIKNYLDSILEKYDIDQYFDEPKIEKLDPQSLLFLYPFKKELELK